MEFNILDENTLFKLGNIVTVFELPGVKEEIALFSVSDFDTDDSSLNVAYIVKDSDGYDHLREIDDNKIFKRAMKAVNDMIGVINNG